MVSRNGMKVCVVGRSDLRVCGGRSDMRVCGGEE